jgi:putative membrane protein
MEDIPFHLGKEVERLAKTRFKHVAVVDSHNCITDARIFTEQELADLKEAASLAIESPLSSRAEFEMGAAKSAFEVGGPEQGVGPGGISVLVLKTFGQVVAYVTIDCNNMALHLREKILASLECLGINGGEIMTTDTHVVNGLVPARLGYHPLGEAIDHNVVIDHVRATVERAKQDLEEAAVSVSSGSVRVKSLGSKSLENLMSFMYGVAKLVALYMLMLFLGSNLVGLMIIH